MTNVSEVVLNAVIAESDEPVSLDDAVTMHLDSLGRVSVAIDIMNVYDTINLVEDTSFFGAITVRELVTAVDTALSRAGG